MGVWRTGYGKNSRGAKVDPSGVTPEGESFTDIHAWQHLYTQHADQLARGFATHFLTYATGAPLRFSNEEALEKTVSNGHGIRSLIGSAILSKIFLTK